MNKIDQLLIYFLSTILFLNLILTVVVNLLIINQILLLSVLIVSLLLFNELFIEKQNKLGFVLLFFAFLFSSWICLIGNGGTVKAFYYVIMYQLYKNYRLRIVIVSYVFLILTYFSIFLVRETNMINKIRFVLSELTLFALVITIIGLVAYIIKQNIALENSKNDVTIKNSLLENTHHHLIQAYSKLEELTIVKEREKIARDMHDTVGHTLTTSLVELEVSQIVLDKNIELAKSKLKGGIDLVRMGLYELRTTVKTLKTNRNYIDEINQLILNSQNHAGVQIECDMDPKLYKLNEKILSCVYRIIQEGITNGIKHGKATIFTIIIEMKSNCVIFFLKDNGVGTVVFNKGFGINAMEERVKELKGDIVFKYEREHGFTIEVVIPMNEVIV